MRAFLLDDLDQRLILELEKDGRISYSDLAHKLGLGISTTARRVNRMLDNNVISIRAVPNPMKMGYYTNVFMLIDAELYKLEDVCSQLTNKININVVVSLLGRFNIACLAHFTNHEMLVDFIKNELSIIEGIRKLEIYFISETRKRYYGWFNDPSFTSITLNKTDRKLIAELERDGRQSYADLAQKVGINVSTVSKRITQMQREDIIKIKAVSNPSKIGYKANAFVTMDVNIKKIDDVCHKLANNSNIYLIATLFGWFDVLIGVHFPSAEMLTKFIKEELANIEGIINIETLYQAEIKKRYYGWFFEDQSAYLT